MATKIAEDIFYFESNSHKNGINTPDPECDICIEILKERLVQKIKQLEPREIEDIAYKLGVIFQW